MFVFELSREGRGIIYKIISIINFLTGKKIFDPSAFSETKVPIVRVYIISVDFTIHRFDEGRKV